MSPVAESRSSGGQPVVGRSFVLRGESDQQEQMGGDPGGSGLGDVMAEGVDNRKSTGDSLW